MQRNNYKPLTLVFVLAIGVFAGFIAARLTATSNTIAAVMPQVTAEHFPELVGSGIDGDELVQTSLFTYATEDGPRVAIVPEQGTDPSSFAIPYPERLHRK